MIITSSETRPEGLGHHGGGGDGLMRNPSFPEILRYLADEIERKIPRESQGFRTPFFMQMGFPERGIPMVAITIEHYPAKLT